MEQFLSRGGIGRQPWHSWCWVAGIDVMVRLGYWTPVSSPSNPAWPGVPWPPVAQIILPCFFLLHYVVPNPALVLAVGSDPTCHSSHTSSMTEQVLALHTCHVCGSAIPLPCLILACISPVLPLSLITRRTQLNCLLFSS